MEALNSQEMARKIMEELEKLFTQYEKIIDALKDTSKYKETVLNHYNSLE